METNEATVSTGNILFAGPFNELLPKYQALTPAEVLAVNLDVPAGVTTVLGVQRAVLELKDRLAQELPQFDHELPVKLNVYALGLAHAHTLYMMASAPADSLQPLVEEGIVLHERLLADAKALVTRKLVDGQQLRDLKGTSGYKNLAFDLQILAQAFHNGGAALTGKCATSPAELERAEQISLAILQIVGLREQDPATVAATSDMRNRAFTLFVRAYNQVRRAMTYLRWNEEDADDIAPSLYEGRGGPTKKKTDAAPAPAPAPGVAAPVAGQSTPATTVVESPSNGAKTGPGAQPFVTAS